MQLDGDHRFIKPIIKHFKGQDVSEISPVDVQHAAMKLYPNHAPATRNRQAITPTQAVLNHAHQLGWRNPIKVERFHVGKTKPKNPVDQQWLDKFMAQADADGYQNVSAAVLFMNHTAARRKEMVTLTGEYFIPDEKIAILRKTKTDEYAIAYLTDQLVDRMIALKPKPGEPLFGYRSLDTINRAMKRICKAAQIDYRSTHEAGRHSFGTNAIAEGADVKTAMDAGRWKSANLFLQTYVHSDEAGRKIAKLIENK